MRYIVYGDVLFFLNFSIDFLVLTLCGCFLHRKRSLPRLLLSSALGGAYAVAVLLPAWPAWLLLVGHLAAAVLLCLIAYGAPDPKSYFTLLFSFFGLSVLLGGSVEALYSFLRGVFHTGNLAEEPHRAGYFMLYVTLGGLLIFTVGRFLQRGRGGDAVMVEIEENGRHLVLRGLLDSGNLLKDPFSGRPVILVREAALSGLIPVSSARVLNGEEDGMPLWQKRKVRVLIAESLGATQSLLGYRPDGIFLYSADSRGGKTAVDAILGLDTDAGRDYGGCAAVVPAQLYR